jgi:hypothetical protein
MILNYPNLQFKPFAHLWFNILQLRSVSAHLLPLCILNFLNLEFSIIILQKKAIVRKTEVLNFRTKISETETVSGIQVQRCKTSGRRSTCWTLVLPFVANSF